MINKLDLPLFELVRAQNIKNCVITIVVYVKDIDKALNYFKDNNFIIKAVYKFINAIIIDIDLVNVNNLIKSHYVNFISSQTKVFAQVDIAKNIIGLEEFYNEGILGQGINVAVIDTGVSPHTDFLYPQNRIIAFQDFVNRRNDVLSYDDNGHGTFISGLIGANGILSAKKYTGVAPLCNLIVLKALDEDGQSTSLEMLEAMQWVFDNKNLYNIDVVCMSFGAMPTSRFDPLMKGAEKLWDSGIVVVAAAGNSGPNKNTIKSPGASKKIITVGAMDDGRGKSNENDFSKYKIADFSSRGPAFEFYKPDLVVSGVDLVSCGVVENYTKMSGTSVSAPIVAGVCALLLQKYDRHISPKEIKSILQKNSHPIFHDRNSEGFGYLSFV